MERPAHSTLVSEGAGEGLPGRNNRPRFHVVSAHGLSGMSAAHGANASAFPFEIARKLGAACCAPTQLGLFVDGAAADYGAEDFGFYVVGWRDFGQVVGKNEEVGVFADFQLALLPFLEFAVGGAGRVGANAVLQRDFFLRLPAAGGSTSGKLARRGGLARDASVESAEGADDFDGIIGAEGETRAAFFQRGPGVSALDAFGTDAGFRPAHVVGLVRRLHGGDDFELGKALEIVGGDDLGVLDAVAAVARAIGFGDGFKDIEGDAVGAVADGVEVELESSFVAFDGERFQLIGLHDQDAADLGIIGIGLEHGGGARTERAVGDHFESAGLEPRVGGAPIGALVFQVMERLGEVQPFRDADGELAIPFELLVGEEIFPSGIILNGSDAILGEIGQNQGDSAAALLDAGVRDARADKVHGRTFLEHAGELSGGVALEFAAGRIGRVLIEFGELEGERIGDGDVARNLGQQHGILGGHVVELPLAGKLLFRPERVIPAGAGDPIAFLVRSDAGGEALFQLFDGGGAVETYGKHACTRGTEVDVGIIESGHEEFFVEMLGYGVGVAPAAVNYNLGDGTDA